VATVVLPAPLWVPATTIIRDLEPGIRVKIRAPQRNQRRTSRVEPENTRRESTPRNADGLSTTCLRSKHGAYPEAGLLTRRSSRYRLAFPFRRTVADCAARSLLTVAGPCGICTRFPFHSPFTTSTSGSAYDNTDFSSESSATTITSILNGVLDGSLRARSRPRERPRCVPGAIRLGLKPGGGSRPSGSCRMPCTIPRRGRSLPRGLLRGGAPAIRLRNAG
jgi:hypothetical protein